MTRTDTDRLNWLDKQNVNGAMSVYLGGPWRHYPDTGRTVGYWKIEDRYDLGRYETIREAIDAAMDSL